MVMSPVLAPLSPGLHVLLKGSSTPSIGPPYEPSPSAPLDTLALESPMLRAGKTETQMMGSTTSSGGSSAHTVALFMAELQTATPLAPAPPSPEPLEKAPSAATLEEVQTSAADAHDGADDDQDEEDTQSQRDSVSEPSPATHDEATRPWAMSEPPPHLEGGEEGASLLLALGSFGSAEPAAAASPSLSPRYRAPSRAARVTSSRTGAPLKRRGVADRASSFHCKFPQCGKMYGCPDAVRKHCRKQHSEWLRSLGNAGPSSYCLWDPEEEQ